MKDSPLSVRRNDYLLLTFLAAFFTPVILFVFRHADDNRLTSWNWAFAGRDVSTVFLFIIAGLVAAYIISHYSFYERYPIICLAVMSYGSVLPFWSEPEVIVDTSRYFTQAKHLREYGIDYFIREWGGEINAWTDLPLVPFVYGLVFKFFGENRIAIQVFTTMMYSAAVISTYLLGSILWNRATGFYGGLLLMGIPYLFTQAPLMLVDVATMFLLTFSVFIFLRALTHGRIWIPLSSLTIVLAFFSKYSTWLMLSVLGIVFAVFMIYMGKPHPSSPGNRLRYLYRGSAVALISTLIACIPVLYKYDLMLEQIDILMTFQKPALKGWSESFASTYLFQIHPFITGAAFVSLFAAIRNRDIRYSIICWLMLIMTYLWVQRIRYILPVFPMFTLMASYGLQEMKDDRVKRFTALSAVFTSLIVAVMIYLPFLQKMSAVNFMNAGKHLDSLNASTIEVITLPPKTFTINPAVSVPLLDLFTGKDISYRYKSVSPPKSVNMSPLRFTWEYQNPAYYRNKSETDSEQTPLVIISSEHKEDIPEFLKKKIAVYKKVTRYETSTGVFRYSPDVLIFDPP